MRYPALSGILLLVAILPTPASAQSASAAAQRVPARLSLDDALATARERNPAYLQAVSAVGVAEARERQSVGGLLPSLDASMSISGYDARRFTGEDDFGRPTEGTRAFDYEGSSSSQSVGLGMTLFDGGGVFHRIGASRARTRSREASADATWAQVRSRVITQYNEVLQQDRLVALAEELLASARQRLEATEARLRLAAVSPVDVLGAEVEVAKREQEVEEARGAARKARLALLEQMGVSGAPAFDPTSEAPPVFDPEELDAERLIADAMLANPTVAQRHADLSAAERSASAARSTRWPTLRASVGLSRGLSASGYGALTELNPQDRTFRFGLSASVPLFDGFRTGAEVAGAEAAASDAQQQLRAERLALEREVRSALIDLENAHRGLALAERSANLSRERLELAQEQFRLGDVSVNFTDLQRFSEDAANAERQAIRARFTFEAARIALEERVGRQVRR